jgi:hypothetical protein
MHRARPELVDPRGQLVVIPAERDILASGVEDRPLERRRTFGAQLAPVTPVAHRPFERVSQHRDDANTVAERPPCGRHRRFSERSLHVGGRHFATGMFRMSSNFPRERCHALVTEQLVGLLVADHTDRRVQLQQGVQARGSRLHRADHDKGVGGDSGACRAHDATAPSSADLITPMISSTCPSVNPEPLGRQTP